MHSEILSSACAIVSWATDHGTACARKPNLFATKRKTVGRQSAGKRSSFTAPAQLHNSTRPSLQQDPSARFFTGSSDDKLAGELLPSDQADDFYPMKMGQAIRDKYQVVAKPGFGTGSTVWLARDLVGAGTFDKDRTNEYRMLKVCTASQRSSDREQKAATNEMAVANLFRSLRTKWNTLAFAAFASQGAPLTSPIPMAGGTRV